MVKVASLVGNSSLKAKMVESNNNSPDISRDLHQRLGVSDYINQSDKKSMSTVKESNI